MRTLTAAAVAAINSGQLGLAQLVYMRFPSVVIALNTANHDIEWAGITYKGAGALGAVGTIEDSPGEIKGLQFQLSGVPTEYLALALADSTVVQGTPMTIRTALVVDYQVVDAPIDWVGRLDTMVIEENGETCNIAVTAESSAVDFLRGTPLTYSNVDQQSLYPGDRAFEYVIAQRDQRIVWPAKQWQLAGNGR